MGVLLKNYSSIIEKVRKDRNLSRDEVCEGIMSKRNYQRFASGEVSISSDKLLLLTDRLMLDSYSLQEFHKTDNQDEYLKLKKAYNYIADFNAIESKKILVTIDRDEITSEVNKQLYKFIDLKIKFKEKKIQYADYLKQIKTIIGFPDVLDKKYINAVEFSGLVTLMIAEARKGKDRIIEFFIQLTQEKSEKSYWITAETKAGIYANVAKSYFHLEKYEKCLEYADSGLDSSLITRKYIAFTSLLGHKSLALHKLGHFNESRDIALRLYMHALVEGNQNKISFVKNLINQNLEFNIDEMLVIKKEV